MKKTNPIDQVPVSASKPRTVTPRGPATYPIRIVAGAYRGSFLLDGKQEVIGNTSKLFDLSPGTHAFDTGAVTRSIFKFTVSADGDVTNVTNPIAATSAGNVLTLNTVEVTVEAGPLIRAGNPYVFLPYPSTKLDSSGEQTFTLVPGLAYQLDSGARWGASTLVFDVHGDGTVWCLNHSASGGKNWLTLNVGWLKVVPEHPVTYRIGKKGPFTTEQSIPVILGLLTYLGCGGENAPFVPEFGVASPQRIPVGGKWFKWSVPWNLPAPAATAAQGTRKKTGAARSKPRA